ncbi:hypothetical protein PIB30_070010, partial [Stylosanthes scabra]|nr:hypothetical protein [Stylosanthes scabra]
MTQSAEKLDQTRREKCFANFPSSSSAVFTARGLILVMLRLDFGFVFFYRFGLSDVLVSDDCGLNTNPLSSKLILCALVYDFQDQLRHITRIKHEDLNQTK